MTRILIFPTVTTINVIFIRLQESYDSMKTERLMNERTLEGVVDKILHDEPFQESFFWDRASILIRDLILEHPFTNGDSRVASVVLTVFLNKNGYEWSASNEDLIKFTLDIASGQLSELKSINIWIKSNTFTQMTGLWLRKSKMFPSSSNSSKNMIK